MSALKVIKSAPVAEGVDPDVIDMLEIALVRARAGEIGGFALVTQDMEGGCKYHVAGIQDRFVVMGFLTHMLHKLQSD